MFIAEKTKQDDILEMLECGRCSDVAADLDLNIDEFDIVLRHHGITEMPAPLDLPDHCSWDVTLEPAYTAEVAAGKPADVVAERIDRLVREAVRQKIWHILDDGTLIRDRKST